MKNFQSPILTELFLRGIKLNISLIFLSQSYFKLPKTIKLNATHYHIMKKIELSKIVSNHFSDIGFMDFTMPYKYYAKDSFSIFSQ